MSSPDSRSGSRRSHSRSRSRTPPRRRHSRSRSYSGSEDESFGGSSQTVRRDFSGSSAKKTLSRKRRRSRSEDLDSTPHRHVSDAYVPVRLTRHAEVQSSDTSDDEEDDDDRQEGMDRHKSRAKKIRKVDVSNPLSTFRKQVRQKKKYLIPSKFAKEEWLSLRKMNAEGKFIQQEDNKTDEWKSVAKSDRLIRRNAGDIFADTRLDDGLHAIVNKDSSAEEKKLAKQQRTMGSIAHLTLQAMESYTTIYSKMEQLAMWCIGKPCEENPQWTGEDDTVHPRYVNSEAQDWYHNHFQGIQREFQVDLAEPLANVTRIAAESFTKALDERRENVISKIRKTNSKAASAITRIPPSSHFMFGGDHAQLAQVVELTKDLSSTANRSFTKPRDNPKYKGGYGEGGGKPRGGPGGRGREQGGRGGASTRGTGGHKKRRKSDAEGRDSSFRGGNSNRGGKH